MNRLKRKITSQSGASITYGLLLFLVCAVVSSVVLTAGTAASGRISKSVKSDQRYYSVSSAADVLKNWIDGASCSVRTPSGDDPQVTMDGIDVTLDNHGGITGRSDFYAVISAAALYAAKQRKEGVEQEDTRVDKRFELNPYSDPTGRETPPSIASNELAVKLDASITASSPDSVRMVLDVYNYDFSKTPPVPASETFKISLIFTAYIETRTEKKGGTDESAADDKDTVQKVMWNYDSISTKQSG